jgi:hypothetical protein
LADEAYRESVQFSPELRAPVLAGEVTLSFRLWTRPKVRVGGRYRVGPAEIEDDDIELVPFSTVSAGDVRRCGEADRESLRRRTAHAGPVADDTLVYRIEFHVVDG